MKITKKQFEKAKQILEENDNSFKMLEKQVLENFDKVRKMKQKIILVAKKGDLKESFKNKFIFKKDDVFNKNNELILNVKKTDFCYKKDIYKYYFDNKELSKNAFVVVSYILQSY